MAQHYSDPSRANDPHTLPNLETFTIEETTPLEECPGCQSDDDAPSYRAHRAHVGWYWWSCFPGCLPDGEAIGPFDTETEALADAREGLED